MTTPKASVIVPMYNASHCVLEQFEALASQSVPPDDYEVIWVDNGSTDATATIIGSSIRHRPNMHLLRATEIPTSYFARNVGAARAKGDVYLFCDADDVVSHEWIGSMAAALEADDLVGGAIGELDPRRPSSPSLWPESVAVRHDFLPAARTANLGVTAPVFEAVGGFDDQLASGGDVDFCWRAQLSGFQLGFCRDAVVAYRGRRLPWAKLSRHFFYGRWFPVWVAPYERLGAESPRTLPTVKRLLNKAWSAIVRPPRRYHAREFLWELGVLWSLVRPPTAHH